VKRVTAYLYGGNRVGKDAGKRVLCNTFSVCVETRTGYSVRVYCTGLLRIGLLSYVSRKEVAETLLVRVRVRSTVPVYALLYVGFGLLSYVSRKLNLPRNQSVLYVQKSVRNP
jgi:hypothetical protein